MTSRRSVGGSPPLGHVASDAQPEIVNSVTRRSSGSARNDVQFVRLSV